MEARLSRRNAGSTRYQPESVGRQPLILPLLPSIFLNLFRLSLLPLLLLLPFRLFLVA